MAHNRKLVIGSSGQVATDQDRRLRKLYKVTIPAMGAARDELEQIIIENDFLLAAPFNWLSLIVREGLKDDLKPSYERMNKKYGCLDLAIEIDIRRLIDLDVERAKRVYAHAALLSLVFVGEKYGLPVGALRTQLERTAS